jgi:hypothetical protein
LGWIEVKKDGVSGLYGGRSLRSWMRCIRFNKERLKVRVNTVDGVVDRARNKGDHAAGGEGICASGDDGVVHDANPLEDGVWRRSGDGGDSTGEQRHDDENDSEANRHRGARGAVRT